MGFQANGIWPSQWFAARDNKQARVFLYSVLMTQSVRKFFTSIQFNSIQFNRTKKSFRRLSCEEVAKHQYLLSEVTSTLRNDPALKKLFVVRQSYKKFCSSVI